MKKLMNKTKTLSKELFQTFNPLRATGPLLYALETAENHRFPFQQCFFSEEGGRGKEKDQWPTYLFKSSNQTQLYF